MRLPFLVILLFTTVVFNGSLTAQQPQSPALTKIRTSAVRVKEIGQTGIVIDETLSVLRLMPSLFSESIQRMRRGRKVQILGVSEADGVKFYRVAAPPSNYGWVQSDAVFGKFRVSDEERLARLVQASDGFDQIEVAVEFLGLYPNSPFRPSILLLFGDLLEEVAVKLSRDATNRLSRKGMAASAAPLHSYYLNFVSIDRYRKLGVIFLFNSTAKQFHYNGASWKEIVAKLPESPEAVEAKRRLDSLKLKMEKSVAR